MKKSNPRFREIRSRATFWGAAVFVTLVVLVAVVLMVTGDGSDERATATPSRSPSPQRTNAALPGGFVTLPAPSSETNGLPTGYPKTPEGATALVMASHRAGSTLDYAMSARVAEAYVTGLDEAGIQEFADRHVVINRQKVKVPLTGDAPLGPGFVTRHDGVQWRVVDEDRVIVSVAVRLEYTHADGTRTEGHGSLDVPVVWLDDRWWLDAGAADVEGLGEPPAYATPGSEEYAALGWKVVRNDDWAGSLL